MAKPVKPATRPVAAAHSDNVIATFDLNNSRCYIVPAGRGSAHGTRNAVSVNQDSPQVVGEFEHAGTRYRVLERILTHSHIPPSQGDADPTRFLTGRELQIVRLICFGHVNKQIAHRLKISEYTVKTYLKQIFMKLNVHNRSSVVFQCATWVGGSRAGFDKPEATPQ